MINSDEYKPRIIDKQIEKALGTFKAISIEGPKWCGKTSTALHHGNSVQYLMDKNTRMLAEIDPKNILDGEPPLVLDEWQEVPEIWDAVRFAADQEKERGRYILTGSIVKPKQSERIRHSGTGRIAKIRMRTMSMFEFGLSSGEISLGSLLGGETIPARISNVDIKKVILSACIGGWPEILDGEVKDPLGVSFNYLDSFIEDDVYKKRVHLPSTLKFRSFLASLARNNATMVKNTTLHDDVQKTESGFSATTLGGYLEVLRELFIMEEIPGWDPGIRSKTRLLSSPKRFFTDPSLAVAALRASPEKLFSELSTFGGIFEGMCLRDLLVYADANDASISHYHDNAGLEIDAIIEKKDGVWGAFEIKLSESEIHKAVKSLHMLKAKAEKANWNPPICLVVLTATGLSMKREDDVLIVPITMLKN